MMLVISETLIGGPGPLAGVSAIQNIETRVDVNYGNLVNLGLSKFKRKNDKCEIIFGGWLFAIKC